MLALHIHCRDLEQPEIYIYMTKTLIEKLQNFPLMHRPTFPWCVKELDNVAPFCRCSRRWAPVPPVVRPTQPPSSGGPLGPHGTTPDPRCQTDRGGLGKTGVLRFGWPHGSPRSEKAPCVPWTGPKTANRSLQRKGTYRGTQDRPVRVLVQAPPLQIRLLLLTLKEIISVVQSGNVCRITRL